MWRTCYIVTPKKEEIKLPEICESKSNREMLVVCREFRKLENKK